MWLRWEPLSLKFSCVLLLLSQPQEPWSTLSISGGRSGALRVILIIVRLISSADHLTCPSWVHLKTKVIAGHDGTHLLSRHLVAESGTSLSLRPAQCAKWVLRQPELLYRKTYLGGKKCFTILSLMFVFPFITWCFGGIWFKNKTQFFSSLLCRVESRESLSLSLSL